MALPYSPALPFILYPYPWMPLPRRLAIYLPEKHIPCSHSRVVRVLDSQDGNQVVNSCFSPQPAGSLPVFALPSSKENGEDGKPAGWFYLRQSTAIIRFLEETCVKKVYGFESPVGSLFGRNPVRTFGTNAGTMSYPEGAKGMLRWVRRPLVAIETWWQESYPDMSLLGAGINGHVTVPDIVLYQFLEFTKYCYGVDMTAGSGDQMRTCMAEMSWRLLKARRVLRGLSREMQCRGEWTEWGVAWIWAAEGDADLGRRSVVIRAKRQVTGSRSCSHATRPCALTLPNAYDSSFHDLSSLKIKIF